MSQTNLYLSEILSAYSVKNKLYLSLEYPFFIFLLEELTDNFRNE
jgi:hypothetical protein